MPSLQEIIQQRLDEATKQAATQVEQIEEKKTEVETIEEKKTEEVEIKKPSDEPEDKGTEEVVDLKPKMKKPVVKEEASKSAVSAQVSALLEAEGLSDEFKLQAVTIFEAAVTDRVLQIEEAMKQDFETQLSEAIESLNTEIDEFLSEAVKQWQKDNEVAIKANFNTQVNESFMDGLRQLIAEHSVEVPEGKEDALETAMSKVEELQEAAKEQEAKQVDLQEQIKTLEGKSILESFRAKMTQVEFDRFKQLTESVKFDTAEQYEKQLSIVLENFGSSKKTEVKQVTESVVPKSTKESTTVVESTVAPQMSQYVAALKFGR